MNRRVTIRVFDVGQGFGTSASVVLTSAPSCPVLHVTNVFPYGFRSQAYGAAEQWAVDHGYMPPDAVRARVHEQGNGLPEVGDYCGGWGQLYRIISRGGPIQTGHALGNWAYYLAVPADWSECPEGAEHTACVAHVDDGSDA